ncbi:MAG: glycosyltransferase family 39 protein [Anaerolineae bacterium]|nr:glycosyltransferase family 39 protein [Anaerolineae bacterium]
MKKHRSAWLVAALCLISFARGVHRLGEASMWWDESLSHYRATQSIATILSNQILFDMGDQTARTIDNHPPLYFLALHLTIRAAGDSEFAMRALSLACGVLLVPLLYACGTRIAGSAAGLASALLGAASPLYLWYQHEIRPYTMVAALGALSTYLLLRQIDLDTPARQRERWGGLVLYLLSVLAMLTTHYLSFMLVVAHGAIMLLSWRRQRAWMGWAIAALVVVAGGVLLWGLQSLPESSSLPSFRYLPLLTLVQDVFQQFSLGLYADVLLPVRWVAVALFLGALLILLLARDARSRRHALYLLLCFALPVLETFALSLVRPAYMNVRHLIYASPFYYLLIGVGVARARRRWAHAPLVLGCGALVAGMLLSTWIYFGEPLAGKAHHREWGRYLADRIRPGDTVIVHPAPIADLYAYYVDSSAKHIGLPVLNSWTDTLAQLDAIARASDRVWVAHSSTPEWADEGNRTLRWLEQNMTRIDLTPFESATTSLHISAYRSAPPFVDAAPHDMRALGVRFDERLDLLGTRSPMDAARAGHVLQLSLYWAPVVQLDRDLRVTIAMTGDDGFTWAYADAVPAHGMYPAPTWPVGQIVRDDVDLFVSGGTPPGRYRLSLSVYAADGGPALAARSQADGQLLGLSVPIGEATVMRPETPPRKSELSIAHPSHRRYGPLALLGHNYNGGSYQPGDVALLDAYWRAMRRPGGDLAFALQLLDGDGNVAAERAIEPAGGYPPSQWQEGEVVRGQYRFRIPIDAAPGAYTLALVPIRDRGALAIWPWQARRTVLHALKVIAPATDRVFALPDMQVTVGANLGDRVELLGYDLAAGPVQPGETVSYTLYWRALDEMARDYTVFNHLVAADGTVWGQRDSQPQDGAQPTTRWVPGQVIADPYQVQVASGAPGGTLSLRVGLYDQQTMLRLPVYDASGQVAGDFVSLTEIEVTAP